MADHGFKHEPDAVPVVKVLLFTLVPAIVIAACLIAIFAFFITEIEGPSAQERWDARPSEGPRISARPAEVREAIEVRDAAWLVRGPGIEAAMEETARAGWRDGVWPSRAYDALELDAPPAQARALPRESDLRRSPAEASPGGEPETGEGAP
ncbi:MAG: hypothetical protein ACFE0P_07565 [Oceanicaulis sp.]